MKRILKHHCIPTFSLSGRLKLSEINISVCPTCLCLFTASPSGQCTGLCTSSFFPRALTQLNFVSHHQHYVLELTTPTSPPAYQPPLAVLALGPNPEPWAAFTTRNHDCPRSSTLVTFYQFILASCVNFQKTFVWVITYVINNYNQLFT